MTEIEIRTAAEKGTHLASTPGGEPMVSVSALTELLRAAAALERAQNRAPIVLHASAPVVQVANLPLAPATSQVAQLPGAGNPGHPGIDVTIPPSVGWAPVRHRAPSRPGWGVKFAVASMLVSLAGGASAGATDGNGVAVVLCALGIAGVLTGTSRAVFEQGRGQ